MGLTEYALQERQVKALESIAASLEKMSTPMMMPPPPPGWHPPQGDPYVSPERALSDQINPEQAQCRHGHGATTCSQCSAGHYA